MKKPKFFLVVLLVPIFASLIAGSALADSTFVPGHDKDKYDLDNNGFPDVGVTTVGVYSLQKFYDAFGYTVWVFDDHVVGDYTLLNFPTLTECTLHVRYRGEFQNDAGLDTGWLSYADNCSVHEKYLHNYLIVHVTDARYTGDPDCSVWEEWGDWEVITGCEYQTDHSMLYPYGSIGTE